MTYMTKTEALDYLAKCKADAARFADKPKTNPMRRSTERTLREARLLARTYAA